jgi:predicted transcriptional regulator
MSTNLTIRFDEELARSLDDAVRRSGRTRSDIVREALRRQLGIAPISDVGGGSSPREKRTDATDRDP